MRTVYRWLLVIGCLLLCVGAAAAQADIALIPFTNETFGIQGVIPEGWAEAGPGTYARGASATDSTVLVVQAAPGATEAQLQGLLTQQLGLDAFPQASESRTTEAFTWNLYALDEIGLPNTGAQIALAETGGTTYIVILLAATDELETLTETVFTPVLESVAPLSDDADASAEAVYTEPEGRFTVPIPTNWTAEQQDGYAVLSDPEGLIRVYVLALEGDDAEALFEQAWELVGVEPEAEASDFFQQEGSEGIELIAVQIYDTGDDAETFYQAVARFYEGTAYILLIEGATEALVRRQSQISVIDTGFAIAFIEQVDLSEVEPLAVNSTITDALAAFISDNLERLRIPGAAVAIVQNGEIVYAEGFGVRAFDGEPVTPETLFQIASVTKTMTTMMMATLVDDEIITWDTPVVEVLPEFAVADEELTQQITLRNLVCACSGVPRRDLEFIFNFETLTAEDTIESIRSFRFFTEFGEAFQYSNQLVATGGYAAAAAAGGEYGDLDDAYIALMQERIFDPIDMTSTTFDFDAVEAADNVALPYGAALAEDYIEIPIDYERTLLPIAPAGGAWSNVLDLARYMITAINLGVSPDGERVVSEENLLETWQPQVAVSADTDYGLGWFVSDYRGLQVINHGGNALGYSTELTFVPEADLGIVVVANGYGTNIFNAAVYQYLLELVYEQEPEVVEQFDTTYTRLEAQAQDILENLTFDYDPSFAEPFVGTYASDVLGELVVTIEDERVFVDAGEFRTPLIARLDADSGEIDAYLAYESPLPGTEFEFTEDDAGAPIVQIDIVTDVYTFERVE